MKTRCWLFVLIVFAMGPALSHAAVVGKEITYHQGDERLQGYLAFDDAIQGRRPGVLVVHEWWGLNEYARSRAEQLAALGYVAFAVDMYGQGKVTQHPEQAKEWSNEISRNVENWRERAAAGLQVLREQPNVNIGMIAAIGYCFGGSTVQQVAYSGADVKGVVSFHGSLLPPPSDASRKVKAKILICHGSADPFNKPEQVADYIKAMNATSIDWQMAIYGGAKHSFTNPGAGDHHMEALQYSPSADRRSWEDMRQFFGEIFGR